MEFNVDINSLLPHLVTRSVGGRLPLATRGENEQVFAAVVDEVGMASARAQGLRVPITTFQKLKSSNHILYILKDPSGCGAIVGILKLGKKRLFLADAKGVQHEVEPLCVLDFYVHESRQRSGCGKKLFAAMLQFEDVKPQDLPIDRPSPKFLNFLKKHYKLQSFVKQANYFVVFDQFFANCVDVGPGRRRLPLHQQRGHLSDGDDTGTLSPSSHAPLPPWRRHSAPFGGEMEKERRVHFNKSPVFCLQPSERPHPQNKSNEISNKQKSDNVPFRSETRDAPNPSKGPWAGAPSSSVFNWSQLSTRRRNVNIITGAPMMSGRARGTITDGDVLKCGQVAPGEAAVHAHKDSFGRIPVPTDQLAPHLNMRRPGGSRALSGRFQRAAVPPSGFRAAVAVEGSQIGAGESGRRQNGGHGYSRHGAMETGHFSAGISGTSLMSHASHVTRLCNPEKSKTKPRDKWKSYIT